MPTVLQLAPHPDDEVLAAGGTLLRLRDAGWTVVTLVCSLGRAQQRERRRAEVEEACARAGFALRLPAAQLAIGSADDLTAARSALAAEIGAALDEVAPALLIGPSPHDEHPAHAVVGRATADALGGRRARPRWWLWSLWGDATPPTLLAELDEHVLARAGHVLAAHAGELARNDYGRLLRARAAAAAVSGPERVFGFGGDVAHAVAAEVFCELLCDEAPGWPVAGARRLEPSDALAGARPAGADAGAWLAAPSARALLAPGAPA